MKPYRLFLFSDGLVLPIVIPLNCSRAQIDDRLARVFSEEVIAARAEIWLGAVKVMDIKPEAIQVLIRMASGAAAEPQPPVAPPMLH